MNDIVNKIGNITTQIEKAAQKIAELNSLINKNRNGKKLLSDRIKLIDNRIKSLLDKLKEN
jgi:septal ring factor EnvC (AmiA/AmiB activator)